MLDKILEYQEIESELVSQETALAKSKDREKASQIQQNLKNQHSRLISLEEHAKSVNQAYTKATEKYKEYVAKLGELENELKNADPAKAVVYEKAFKDFSAISNSIEKELAEIYANIQQISKEYENIIKKSKTDRELFDKFKASYNKFKAEKEPLVESLREKLSAKKKEVDSKLFEVYQQKRDGKLFPVFVELNATKCGGCRMEISASKLGQMKTNKFGIVECENCGRFNFKK